MANQPPTEIKNWTRLSLPGNCQGSFERRSRPVTALGHRLVLLFDKQLQLGLLLFHDSHCHDAAHVLGAGLPSLTFPMGWDFTTISCQVLLDYHDQLLTGENALIDEMTENTS